VALCFRQLATHHVTTHCRHSTRTACIAFCGIHQRTHHRRTAVVHPRSHHHTKCPPHTPYERRAQPFCTRCCPISCVPTTTTITTATTAPITVPHSSQSSSPLSCACDTDSGDTSVTSTSFPATRPLSAQKARSASTRCGLWGARRLSHHF
jgi:hypothetical protein